MEKDFNIDLENALAALRSGGIIVYPTDTIWGIGCDACNPDAVAAIYSLKKREDSKSMLSLVGSREMLSQWVSDVPEEIFKILDNSERPVTCIYPHPGTIAANLLAEDGSAGIRVSKDKFSSLLCRAFGKPIVSTSANISGTPAPSFFKEISTDILNKADYVVKHRQDEVKPGLPSRIIKILPDGEIVTIR